MANATAMFEIQADLYAVLEADGALLALAPVFDAVEEGQALPYVEIGEIEETLDNVFNKQGRDLLISLHIYSESPGYKQAEQILERLNIDLDATLLPNTTNWRVTQNEYHSGSAAKEFDVVEIRHVIARYHVKVEQLN
jgi:hypothetical protein